MSRNDSPRPLHHELDEKRAEHEQSLIRRIGPERDDESSQNKSDDDRSPAAPLVGEVAKDDAAQNSSHAGDGSDYRPTLRSEVPLSLQEGRIHVLRAVR